MENKLIEIYLFVDPLGKKCNNARKVINKFRKEHAKKIKLRVIPIVNAKKVLGYARKNKDYSMNSFVDKNNKLSTNTYKACLAFHASTMQGKNVGYKFLAELQSTVVENKEPFSEDLVYKIAEDLDRLDLTMFSEDYKSDLARRIYQRNLKLAAEMNIKKTPSCVIIKNGSESEAIRVDHEIEDELLSTICGLDELALVNEKSKNKIIDNILNFTPLT